MSVFSPTEDTNPPLSLAAAAEYLGVAKDTIRRAIRREELAATKSNVAGEGYQIRTDALDAWLKRYGSRLDRHRPQQQPPEAAENLAGTGQRPHTATPDATPTANRLVAELAAEEHRLAARIDALSERLREVEAANHELRQANAVLQERDRAARAVLLEARDAMQIQQQRVDDLKAEKAAYAGLLKQAHDRLLAIDGERRSLLDRLLELVDVNLRGRPVTTPAVQRERH